MKSTVWHNLSTKIRPSFIGLGDIFFVYKKDIIGFELTRPHAIWNLQNHFISILILVDAITKKIFSIQLMNDGIWKGL